MEFPNQHSVSVLLMHEDMQLENYITVTKLLF